jgi:hypothetical protein
MIIILGIWLIRACKANSNEIHVTLQKSSILAEGDKGSILFNETFFAYCDLKVY